MPDREVWVLVSAGSYLKMNSEIATSVMLDKKLNIVVLDNGGFGCIDRLQRSCGGASFNNLFANGSGIDFAGRAASLGARSRKVADLAELEAALPEGAFRAAHFGHRHRHRPRGEHERGRGLVGRRSAQGVESGRDRRRPRGL
jgi:TPP-dependent trihydroxycyclohexane-1,2-dione (THcHDO) dehydratase